MQDQKRKKIKCMATGRITKKVLDHISNINKENKQRQLTKNLLNKGVDNISEFKRVYGYGQGLDKAFSIINETIEQYKKGGDIEDE